MNSEPYRDQRWNAPHHQQKDTGITLLFGVLLGLFSIMGVGHLYIGKKKRGIAIMLGGFALVVASLVVNLYYPDLDIALTYYR